MWNFKGYLWNSTQNILPVHLKYTIFVQCWKFKSSQVYELVCVFGKPSWPIEFPFHIQSLCSPLQWHHNEHDGISNHQPHDFLAATKQLYKWYFPSVCPSVCLSHLFHHVPIMVSSWNFQELLPWSKVISMQKVKVRGQRSRSQRSTPNLAVSGL